METKPPILNGKHNLKKYIQINWLNGFWNVNTILNINIVEIGLMLNMTNYLLVNYLVIKYFVKFTSN